MRKVIHLVQSWNALLALCDDGSIWEMQENQTEWKRFSSVP